LTNQISAILSLNIFINFILIKKCVSAIALTNVIVSAIALTNMIVTSNIKKLGSLTRLVNAYNRQVVYLHFYGAF